MGWLVGIFIFAILLWIIFLEKWPSLVKPKLYIDRSFPLENCYVDETVELSWKLGNKSWLPVNWMQVYSEFASYVCVDGIVPHEDDSVPHMGVHCLKAKSELSHVLKLQFKKRGYYLMKDVRYIIADYLGSNKYEGSLQDTAAIYVYPKLRPIPELVDNSKLLMGNRETRRWIAEDPLIHTGSRDYTGAEPMKHIHWNATAQTGKLQVKKFAYTTETACMVVVNVQTTDRYWKGVEDGLLEVIIETAASYVHDFEQEGALYGLASNSPILEGAGGVMIPIANGRKHYHRIFKTLSQMTHFSNTSMEEVIRHSVRKGQRETKLLLLTGCMNDQMFTALREAKRKGCEVEVVTTTEVAKSWSSCAPELNWKCFREAVNDCDPV